MSAKSNKSLFGNSKTLRPPEPTVGLSPSARSHRNSLRSPCCETQPWNNTEDGYHGGVTRAAEFALFIWFFTKLLSRYLYLSIKSNCSVAYKGFIHKSKLLGCIQGMFCRMKTFCSNRLMTLPAFLTAKSLGWFHMCWRGQPGHLESSMAFERSPSLRGIVPL